MTDAHVFAATLLATLGSFFDSGWFITACLILLGVLTAVGLALLIVWASERALR